MMVLGRVRPRSVFRLRNVFFFFLNALIIGGSPCNRYDLCHAIRRLRPVGFLGLKDSKPYFLDRFLNGIMTVGGCQMSDALGTDLGLKETEC